MAGPVRRRVVAAATTALTAALATALGAVATGAPSVAGAASDPAGPCGSSGPIRAAALAGGIASAECDLTGRVVVAGDVAALVPPEGYGVRGDGVAGAGGAEPPTLTVTHFAGVVRARVGGEAGGSVESAGSGAADAGACQAEAYRLEGGGHKWGKAIRWRYQRSSTPGHLGKAAALRQIKVGINNMRNGRDSCGLVGKPKANQDFLGGTSARPDVKVKDGKVRCGAYNTRNVVGWGNLPGGLLGYTCYWWGSDGKMLATDMRLSPAKRVVIGVPTGCSGKYDLQSIATHEWGHSYGLGHVANSNLTMHHFLPPCSRAFRTLGKGDWRGMKKLYGLR